MSEVGNRVREARKKAGLNQGELGKRVGVTRSTVAVWEEGGKMSVERFMQVAGVLEVRPGDLLGDYLEEEAAAYVAWRKSRVGK